VSGGSSAVSAKSSYLTELEQKSRVKQEQFMQHIADRLKRPRVTDAPAHPFRGAPDFWNSYDLPMEERIEVFMRNWKAVGGHPHRFADLEAAKAFIADIAEQMQAKHFIRQDEPLLNEANLEAILPTGSDMTVWEPAMRDELIAKAAGADMSFTSIEYAGANTGTIVVKSTPIQGRSVSLLPTVFMALIPAENIRTTLGEMMGQLDATPNGELPAGVHFISGPSRSADIENDLTIGVHGPGIVYALIIG
jgi:L-lactate dehydrogenase complex protein LldG